MKDCDGILELLGERKSAISKQFGVTRIGLFGSYVRNEQHEGSDVDIVVELESINAFRAYFGLKRYLEDLLGVQVDLGIEHAIKPSVREMIRKTVRYV